MDEGETNGAVVIFRDISARLTTRAARRNSEDKNQALLSAIPDLMFRIHRDGTFLEYFSPASETLALPGQDFLGKRVIDVMPAAFAAQAMQQVIRTLETGGPETLEYQLPVPLPNGPLHDFEARFVPSWPDEALTIVRDITDRRQVDRLKDEFVSLVSHELRTPLTSIKGYVDVLLDGELGVLTGEQIEFLEIVSKNTDRLTAIVSDLLDISRIESGTMALSVAEHDVGAIVRRVCDEVGRIGSERGVDTAIELPDEALTVMVDETRTTQVLTNLLSNAYKYSPSRSTVTVRVSGVDGTVRIEIADQGIGIAEGDQERLFTKFYRASSALKEGIGGTGLGLVIARSLAELQGGGISVKSELGKGSIFAFNMPLANLESGRARRGRLKKGVES
jgi:signal transduction histidine kinase